MIAGLPELYLVMQQGQPYEGPGSEQTWGDVQGLLLYLGWDELTYKMKEDLRTAIARGIKVLPQTNAAHYAYNNAARGVQ